MRKIHDNWFGNSIACPILRGSLTKLPTWSRTLPILSAKNANAIVQNSHLLRIVIRFVAKRAGFRNFDPWGRMSK